MADRTSAGLFGKIFQLLAVNPTDEHKQIASEIFDMTGEYDFSNYQMYAEEACHKLDLCRTIPDPEYPDAIKVLWKGDDDFDKSR